ncbi:MAG: diguanylate cyclase domain-containing protein, partial [Thiohalomonadales bacterium]
MNTKPAYIVENKIKLLPDQAEQVLILQKEILESVALGHDYQLILDQLCKAAEALVPNSLASIMLFNENKSSLIVKSAPSMPIAAKEQLTGLVPGESAGSCGTAVYDNTPQFVCNTAIDPKWATFGQYIKDFSIGACWSMPIRNLNGDSIGSFALSSFEERTPSDFHKHLLATSSTLTSIVLNRHDEQMDLEFAAHHDALTNLPNRTLFLLRLNHAIEQAKRKNKKLALLFMDLDNFKVINDTQGHEAGDQVLKVAAQKMKDCVREADTLARLGGDEFVLLVDDVDDDVELRHIADKFLSAFETPIEISGKIYTLTTSIGISLYPADGKSADMLLQTSDTAMYEAKARGRNTYVYYKPELTTLVHERVKLESELRAAITNKDLVVYYQPIFSIEKNEIVSIEALVRWQHAEKGLIPPDDFISLAEETGLINDLGEYVVKTAAQQCMKWWRDDLKEFTLSVNIS